MKKPSFNRLVPWLGILLLLAGIVTKGEAARRQAGAEPRGNPLKRPNIVLVLLDDVGFGALGSYGGPIRTPHIDQIANNGLRLTNFHTTALCSPTRAALLSGRNHHSMGFGVISEMTNAQPGYNGILPKNAALLPRHLKDNGYATFALGKWHNTPIHEASTSGPYDRWPTSLGFERFYGFLGGETNNWVPALWENTVPVNPSRQAGYHLTVDMADHAISYLRNSRESNPDKPFFLFFAPGAGHAPHHVPKEYADRYAGRFDKGWDVLRAEILARQKQMGIVPANTDLSPRPESIKAWDSLSADEKRLYARMMEVFAGFIEHTDEQVGRIVSELRSAGELDNTIFIVTSDNGASGEGSPEGSYNEMRLFNALGENLEENLKNIDKLGSAEAYNHYPAGWALAMNTPNKYWKQFTHEGGVQDPFVIQWPNHFKDIGSIRRQFMHANDVMPTLFDLTQIKPAEEIDGLKQMPIEGVSLAPSLFDSSVPTAKKLQYFEMFGNRALWAGGWKAVVWHGRLPWQTGPMRLVPFAEDKWELYHSDVDESETHNLAAKYPKKVKELKALFEQEARKFQVYPLDDRLVERLKENNEKFTKGKFEFAYAGVRERIPNDLAPPTKNRSFSITAEVDVPASGCEGILVQHGGRFGGYGFFCKDGKLSYAHNFVAESTYEVSSDSAVPAGHVILKLEFEKTGVENGLTKGTAKLFVNGNKVGEGKIPRTVPVLYPETFNVGLAPETAVSPRYSAPFPFTGKIGKVTVKLTREPGNFAPPSIAD